MHYLILQYRHPDSTELVSYLEALFALTDEIEILASSASFRRQEGVILIAWNGSIDLALLQQVNGTLDIADYSILTAPPQAESVAGGGKQTHHGALTVLPIRAEEEDEPPMVLRGPFPRSWYQEGKE
ncbi:MAG TPA: hypothetical protein VFB60_04480 [Ktedonobacteraceae bacterium]|nr:hypothetical protein [Ktedonobacteraceae bacterium]